MHEIPILEQIGSSPRMWGTLLAANQRHAAYRFIPTHVGNTAGGDAGCGGVAVHPHACGEHSPGVSITSLKTGSSPRMWGTRGAAGGGKTDLAVHPHACGEHFVMVDGRRFYDGSSPRMWGTPCWAYQPIARQSVHPHACGEHSCGPCLDGTQPGSSPRMWGTLDMDGWQAVELRFIPTHVGNTPTGRAWAPSPAVHPHACGEHVT